jgi:molybdenum cofactor cytidylyltransferase
MRHDLSPARIVPIVLAAGTSSRMGRVKALLDFDGRTALELALEAMAGLATPVVVLGRDRAEIENRVDLSRARIAMNADVATGQAASLRAGLALLPSDAQAFVFMPVDHPLVRQSDVTRLLEAARREPAKDVFLPVHAGHRGHPVLCRRALATDIFGLPPGTAVRTALHANPDRLLEVPFPDSSILTDMDTPDDYARCLEAFRAGTSLSMEE